MNGITVVSASVVYLRAGMVDLKGAIPLVIAVAGGHFHLPLMAAATVAVIVGSQIGARLMKEKMKAAWIKKMFAGVLLAVSVKLFLKVLF